MMLKPVDCPYCGEQFTAAVDGSGGSQDYIEDCPVCCRPNEIHIELAADGAVLGCSGRGI